MQGIGFWMRAALLAGMLMAVTQPVLAQSASGFRLPPGPSSTSTPRVQGPVDPDNPVISGPRPSPRPSPSPVPQPTAATPTPTAAAAAPTPRSAVTAPQPATTAARPQPQPRQISPGTPTPQPAQGQPATPTALPSTPPTNTPIFSTAPGKAAAPSLVPNGGGSAIPAWVLPTGGGLLALLLALLGVVWWRRRREEAPIAVEFERPVVPEPTADTQLATKPVAIPEPALSKSPPVQTPPAAVAQAVEQDGIAITLEAKRMSASLMATTLSYRLTLANKGKEPLAALAIEGDMIAAQADLPTERQVAARDQALALRHALVELAPGETAEFTGDIRLPLNEIVPIRAGNAAYFIPLARFRVATGAKVLAQTFVVGETPADPTAALKPFRLDLGPRTYSKIGQRAV